MKREVSTSHSRKNVYFALCHTLHHYGPLWIIFALHCVHAVYIIIIFPYCISSATIFPISTIFSPSFFGFSSAIFFSISIYCGFTSFYHYAALVLPFCTWLCFFSFLSLFWCRNLFLVQIIPFSQPSYISVYRLLFCLKILRCLCVVTSWFATITFPVSAYIDSLCARISMLVDPQHQYIVFWNQFLKGGFYTGKNRAPPTAEITCSSKRRFLHSRKGKFLFYSLPCFYAHYPNSSAGVFRCLFKERLLHRKNQL